MIRTVYNIIEYLLKNLPDGLVAVRAPRRAKPSETVSRYEAPRGGNIHYIKSSGGDKPERLKIRAPTLANYPATVAMLKNGYVADIPLIFAAIDPCICCAERTVILINSRSGEEKSVPMSRLRRLAAKRWRKVPVRKDAVWPF
jgi:Ni,Fe-hydrogenase III large subunit